MTMRLVLVTALFWSSFSSYAGVTLGISGSGSTNHARTTTYRKGGVSANVAFDLSAYFRLGYTHRRSFDNEDGLTIGSDGITLVNYYENVSVITDSVDLTIILYRGLVSPFVFGGIARKRYITKAKVGEGDTKVADLTTPAVPNGGFGFFVALNRNFNLKVSQTYSPGETWVLEDEELRKRSVLDTYTQVGINYHL